MNPSDKTEPTTAERMAKARMKREAPGAGVPPFTFVNGTIFAVRVLLDRCASMSRESFGGTRSYYVLNDISRLLEAVAVGEPDVARAKLEAVIAAWTPMLDEHLLETVDAHVPAEARARDGRRAPPTE